MQHRCLQRYKRCPATEKGGTLKKVSHYLCTKGETLTATERALALFLFKKLAPTPLFL